MAYENEDDLRDRERRSQNRGFLGWLENTIMNPVSAAGRTLASGMEQIPLIGPIFATVIDVGLGLAGSLLHIPFEIVQNVQDVRKERKQYKDKDKDKEIKQPWEIDKRIKDLKEASDEDVYDLPKKRNTFRKWIGLKQKDLNIIELLEEGKELKSIVQKAMGSNNGYSDLTEEDKEAMCDKLAVKVLNHKMRADRLDNLHKQARSDNWNDFSNTNDPGKIESWIRGITSPTQKEAFREYRDQMREKINEFLEKKSLNEIGSLALNDKSADFEAFADTVTKDVFEKWTSDIEKGVADKPKEMLEKDDEIAADIENIDNGVESNAFMESMEKEMHYTDGQVSIFKKSPDDVYAPSENEPGMMAFVERLKNGDALLKQVEKDLNDNKSFESFSEEYKKEISEALCMKKMDHYMRRDRFVSMDKPGESEKKIRKNGLHIESKLIEDVGTYLASLDSNQLRDLCQDDIRSDAFKNFSDKLQKMGDDANKSRKAAASEKNIYELDGKKIYGNGGFLKDVELARTDILVLAARGDMKNKTWREVDDEYIKERLAERLNVSLMDYYSRSAYEETKNKDGFPQKAKDFIKKNTRNGVTDYRYAPKHEVRTGIFAALDNLNSKELNKVLSLDDEEFEKFAEKVKPKFDMEGLQNNPQAGAGRQIQIR